MLNKNNKLRTKRNKTRKTIIDHPMTSKKKLRQKSSKFRKIKYFLAMNQMLIRFKLFLKHFKELEIKIRLT